MSRCSREKYILSAWAVCFSLFVIRPDPARAAEDDEVRFTVWGDYVLGPASSLELESGVAQVAGDFDVAINDASRFGMTNATLQFIGAPGAGPYELEALAENIGFCDLSLPNAALFSFKRLRLGPLGITVRLVDHHDNAPGAPGEALYAQTLVIEPGTTLDLAGLRIYYDTITPADPHAPGSGVTLVDSVGGGGLFSIGAGSPDGPDDAAVTPTEICVGQTADLSATVDPGLEVDWYVDDCGVDASNDPLGTYVGSGNPLLGVSPAVTTTYYAQARDPLAGCISVDCQSTTLTVHDNPLCTITADALVCTRQTGLSASVQNAGPGATYAWTLIGGAITAGQNTDTITYDADAGVTSIDIEVTVTNEFTCDTTCQTSVSADRYNWIGPSGGLFTDAGNWHTGIVPGTGSPGGDAVVRNASGVDNTCVLNTPGEIVVCGVELGATGVGRQTLQVEEGSTLTTTTSMRVEPGGQVRLRDGELAGGPVENLSNTITGYGRISADLINAGLVEARPDDNHILRLAGNAIDNQPTGTIRATVGTLVLAPTAGVTQTGTIEVQSAAAVRFDTLLTNSFGGAIALLGGTLATNGLHNQAGASITGTGAVQSSLDNEGLLLTIADTIVFGDLANDGTVVIQNGLLTVTGTLSGNGTIIGGFGGRDGGVNGLTIHGDFDVAATDSARFDLTASTLQLDGVANQELQTLEVMGRDVGERGVRLPAAVLFSIGTLRIGPSHTLVKLVDARRNSPGSPSQRRFREALYVEHLVIEAGVTLDLGGIYVYCERVTQPAPRRAVGVSPIIDTVGGGRIHVVGR